MERYYGESVGRYIGHFYRQGQAFLIKELKELGIDIVYKEYPVGHGVAPQNFYDFKNWLLQH